MSTRDQQSALKGARDAEPREDAAPVEGQALQDQIGQALQPAMEMLREQLTATVRRGLEEKLHQPGRTSHSPTERSGERPSEENREAAPRESWPFDASDLDDTAESRPIDSPELGRALQEQISQALQPAMAEFREQMAATVRQELDETLHRDRRRASADAGRATDRARAEAQASSDEGADQWLTRAVRRAPTRRVSGVRRPRGRCSVSRSSTRFPGSWSNKASNGCARGSTWVLTSSSQSGCARPFSRK